MLEALFLLLYPFLYLFLWRKSYNACLGYGPRSIPGPYILVHAASVGEINAVKSLLMRVLKQYPELSIVLTCNTQSGLTTAQKLSPRIFARIAPLDIWHLRYLQLAINPPRMVLIVETEIWPNLLAVAAQYKIPVLFLNARISAKSFGRYNFFKSFLRLFESSIRMVCAQTVEDEKRFQQIFNIPVSNCGNLKFAALLPEYEGSKLRKIWGYDEADFVLVWGSSRPGEEELLLSMVNNLLIPRLRLIVAPRHMQRLDEVLALLRAEDYTLFSEAKPPQKILVINEIGHLNEAYSICDLAIVGGSFFDFGGHNPLEPAFYKKAIIIGEHHASCRQSVESLLAKEGIIVSSKDQLKDNITSLYENNDLRIRLGENAKRCLTENAKALDLHLDQIKKILE
ncbi:MAG: glycosyltransferase N-terminal domain-containing protein [Candidatus Cloacimonetes bacterium]|nr:glycosyltransferase N-terminal domain-containing protein [Candidatus Cloacimonadota bacterium]